MSTVEIISLFAELTGTYAYVCVKNVQNKIYFSERNYSRSVSESGWRLKGTLQHYILQ